MIKSLLALLVATLLPLALYGLGFWIIWPNWKLFVAIMVIVSAYGFEQKVTAHMRKEADKYNTD